MAQVATHPHCTTWSGRKFYGNQVAVPTGVQEVTASNDAELQTAIDNPANIVIYVDGSCEGITTEILAAHSGAGQTRYIVGKAGATLARIMMFRSFNWVFTADGTTADWLNFSAAKASFTYNGQSYSAGTVFGGITCVDVKDVTIDRWRFQDTAGFLTYYSTSGNVVENLVVQNGNHRNTNTDNPREAVLISRPAWCGEMISGSGSTTVGPFWDVRSLNCRLVNNLSANAADWFQNTGNGHVAVGGWPAWACSQQTGANSLSDEGLIIAGNQLWVDEYVYNEQGLYLRAKATENAIDFKNGSLDANNPIKVFDNIFWGFAPGRGWGDGDSVTVSNGHLEDQGVAINAHYIDSQNIEIYDNIIVSSNRAIYTGKGYSKRLVVDHNLIYNGPATLNGAELYQFQSAWGQNGDPFGMVLQEHYGGGSQSCNYNHMMFQRVCFSNNVRLGDPAPSCIGNVALGGGSWIGQLAGMSPQNCLSDKSGFGTQANSSVLANAHDLRVQVRDPANLDDPTAVVTLFLPQALIDANDAPTTQNRWVSGNEEPPGASAFGLSLAGVRKSTAGNSTTFTLQAGGGVAPYTYTLLGYDDNTASASLSGTTLTINKGSTTGSVSATVRVTDAEFETDTSIFTATFEAAQIPDVVWTSNSEPYPSTAPASKINDGDLSFDGGWTGSTAGGVPASATAMWPVPHDLTLVRTIEALDDQRDYYRTWEYTTDGTTWTNIPEFGTVSTRKQTELEWENTVLNLQGVVGISRVGTGNSQVGSEEWQRVTEVALYGVPSEATLTPPTCDGYTVTMGQGETIIITPEDVGTLAVTDGGDLLSIDATPLSITPATAGVISLNNDGNIELTSTDDFAGEIAITCTVRASESA